jgi:hypothetical protein
MSGKQLDKTITTIKNFNYSIKGIPEDTQMYIQVTGPEYNDSALIEITEVQLNLPKDADDVPTLILRCM